MANNSDNSYTGTDYLAAGTAPAQSGALRLPNAGNIVWRNAAGTADSTSVFYLDSTDRLSFDAASTSGLYLKNAGVTKIAITANGVLVSSGVPLVNYVVTNAQTGTSYTLVIGDASKMVELSNTSAITLTVPTNASVAFPVGTQINLLQTNTGQVTVVGATGVTVNGSPGLKLTDRWSAATLIKRATDLWVLVGRLSS